MATIGIQEIICSLFKLGATCYTWPIDKLLVEYLLVPSVILIVFLFIITKAFLHNTNLKIHALLAIVFYIAIVYTGIYGIIASFSFSFLILFLILGFGVFIITRVIRMEWITGVGKMAIKLGEKKYDIIILKDRKEVLEKEKEAIEELIEKEKKKDNPDDSKIKSYELMVVQIQKEIDLIDKQIKRAEKLIPK